MEEKTDDCVSFANSFGKKRGGQVREERRGKTRKRTSSREKMVPPTPVAFRKEEGGRARQKKDVKVQGAMRNGEKKTGEGLCCVWGTAKSRKKGGK